jgi:hypothetical protein
MDVHAVAWESIEGPRSITGPFTWALVQALTWATKPRSPPCASGAEGKHSPVPGTTPAPGGQGATDTRQGGGLGPSVGISRTL